MHRIRGIAASAGALLSLTLVVPAQVPTASAMSTGFADVTDGVFAHDVAWLVGQGVVEGCREGAYCPSQAVTRGELAVLLVRAVEPPQTTRDAFEDDDGGPFELAIDRAAAAGFAPTCATGRFCPDRPATRAATAAMLAGAFELTREAGSDVFTDDDGHRFEDAIDAVAGAGVSRGCDAAAEQRFCPSARLTRGQVAGLLRRALGGPEPDPAPPTHRFTAGTNGATDYEVGPVSGRSAHGNRIYCTISHFSYDDPVVLPGQPGAAHLHMFWGNTATDAWSTPASLAASGTSSCEGGVRYRSSLWMPALYTTGGEVAIPERTFVYYKTFLPGDLPDTGYALLQEVPQGLEFLASMDTLNAGPWHLRHGPSPGHDGRPEYGFSLEFPSCVATHDGSRTGDPVLSHRDMPGGRADVVNSHVAYPGGPDRNALGCPGSHPYRFPTPIAIVDFDAALLGPQPYLSSDAAMGADPLSTLHADYVFGVADGVNATILRCVVEARSCGFEGGRGQLPDRFLSPAGDRLYRYSVTLEDGTDRTPFGALPPLHAGHGA